MKTDRLVKTSQFWHLKAMLFELFRCLVNSTIDLSLCTILRFILANIKQWQYWVLRYVSLLNLSHNYKLCYSDLSL